MQLSAIVIAKNGEDVIEDCLRSISFCDEIIVIDGGSVDATVAIAKKFGAKIITETTNNFAEKRNIGLRAAKGEWVLYVDTDERVSPSLRDNIKYQISKYYHL